MALTLTACVLGRVAVAVEVVEFVALIAIEGQIYLFDVHDIPCDVDSFDSFVRALDCKLTAGAVATHLCMFLEVKSRCSVWLQGFNFYMLLFVAVENIKAVLRIY